MFCAVSSIQAQREIYRSYGDDLPYYFGLEAGLGLNFYLPFVTVSPEIKFSYGITNLHQLDRGLKYSNVLDKLQSRMIVFSIHLED